MQTALAIRVMLQAVVLIVICAAPVTATPYGEDPSLAWQQLLGGSADDHGASVQQTADGGYILLGYSGSSQTGDVTGTNHGANDYWVVKLDSGGTIQWQRLLGGSSYDNGVSVQQTADGGYILLGTSGSSASGDVTGTSHGGYDYWAVKLDGSGAIQWEKLLGGSGDDCAFSVRQTADGGYVVVGQSTSSASGDVTGTSHGGSDYWVVKLDGAGTVEWQKLLGGSGHDYGYSVQQTFDGGYVLFGQSLSSMSGDVGGSNNGGADYWVVKLDELGAVQWQKLLGGSGTDNGQCVQQTADGGYVVIGISGSSSSGNVTGTNHGITDYWVVKLGSTGVIQWQKLLGGAGSDFGLSVTQASDGGYVLLGYSTSTMSGDVADISSGWWDYWVVKMTAGPYIHLSRGWNFVSVPAVLITGADTAAIFSGVDTDGHSIFLYNATSKAWAPMTSTTKVKPLDGIWIYSKTTITVPLAFDTNPLAVPPAKDLAAGWNAIGYGARQPASARDALSSLTGKWSMALGYDADGHQYDLPIYSLGSGAYADTRELFAGKGYWLYMREPGQLAGPGV